MGSHGGCKDRGAWILCDPCLNWIIKMRINMQCGSQNTLIVEGLSTEEFVVGDYLIIDEKLSILTFNLKYNSPIVETMYRMMRTFRPFSIIIMTGVNEVVNFKGCNFEMPSLTAFQFSFKFLEMIVFKSDPKIDIPTIT